MNKSSKVRATVILHVGFPKTGSSFLQSALSLSREVLEIQGIHYPPSSSDSDANRGLVTSGNMSAAPSFPKDIRQQIATQESKFSYFLLSNESIFLKFLDDPEQFSSLANEFNLEIVGFLRNPAEWVISSYDQSVKRHLETRSLEQYIRDWKLPYKVADFLALCTSHGITPRVENYSLYKEELLDRFSRMLPNFLSAKLVSPQAGVVNRSLTSAERITQRLINQHLGDRRAQLTADSLVDKLPMLKTAPADLTTEERNLLFQEHYEVLLNLNQFLPGRHELDLRATASKRPQEPEKASYSFSLPQLEVIVESLVSSIQAFPPPSEAARRRSSGAKLDLVWHFGVHKTGTTSFQKWLLDNSGRPDVNFCCLHKNRSNLQRLQQRIKNQELAASTVLEGLRECEKPLMVLSAEATVIPLRRNLQWLLKLTNDLNSHDYFVRFVGLVRRQEFYVESGYFQHIKMVDRILSIEEWIDTHPNLNWANLIQPLLNQLPTTNEVSIGAYRENEDGHDRLRNLCGLVGSRSPVALNKRPSRQMIILMSMFKTAEERKILLQDFSFVDTDVDFLPLLSPDRMREIAQRYRESNYLCRGFLSEDDLHYLSSPSIGDLNWREPRRLAKSDISRAEELVRESLKLRYS